MYIDDAALGIPLMFNGEVSGRDYVNWREVRVLLQDKHII
jgi:hypothetical protein